GVRVQGTQRLETQGSLQTTGNGLDMAIDGNGYFQIQLPGGGLGYTRAGNFSRSAEGQLVTAEGYQVMPGVTIPEGAISVTVGSDGTVS
ncbi:flagellar hook-basal body complex protein, partial [Escherichia coli]|nr:flagellar hook-basal body complex protein [Escherichia coli]